MYANSPFGLKMISLPGSSSMNLSTFKVLTSIIASSFFSFNIAQTLPSVASFFY